MLAYFAHYQTHPVILSALFLEQNLYLIALGHSDEEAHFIQIFFQEKLNFVDDFPQQVLVHLRQRLLLLCRNKVPIQLQRVTYYFSSPLAFVEGVKGVFLQVEREQIVTLRVQSWWLPRSLAFFNVAKRVFVLHFEVCSRGSEVQTADFLPFLFALDSLTDINYFGHFVVAFLVVKSIEIAESPDLFFLLLLDLLLPFDQLFLKFLVSVDSFGLWVFRDFLLSLVENLAPSETVREISQVSEIVAIEGSVDYVVLLNVVLKERWAKLILQLVIESGLRIGRGLEIVVFDGGKRILEDVLVVWLFWCVFNLRHDNASGRGCCRYKISV